MPLNTDLNVAPYFDDFEANNQYYRVLFRPSVAVQARELTQVQSILQNQIESFGNWAFKNGDIVSGCSITDDPLVNYVRLSDKQVNGSLYDATLFANALVVSSSSNLTATVLVSNNGLAFDYPNTKIAYVNYINTGDDGEQVFHSNSTSNNVPETLTFYTNPRTGDEEADTIAIVNTFVNSTSQNSVGRAHGIHVDAGIVYLNGTFVQVLAPTYGIVNNYGTYAGNSVVGFELVETLTSDAQDETLLDNALGYPNENAPGAHRLKLRPVLTAFSDDVSVSNTFNPIVTYNYGALLTKSDSANAYSVVADILAKRTYEESGNYVVNPFFVDSISSSSSIVDNIDPNHFLGRVNPGKGYAQGYPVGYEATRYLQMRRGVDTVSEEDKQVTFNYGSYYVLNEVAGSFAFDKAQSVDLYDGPLQAVTTRAFTNLTPGTTGANTINNGIRYADKIGTALMRCFTYNGSGIPGSNTAQYTLHIFNFKMNVGKSPNDVKSVFYNGTVKGIGDVAIPGVQSSLTKNQLFSFGLIDTVAGLKNLRNAADNLRTEYTYRTKISGTLNTSGDITVPISSSPFSATGGTDILPYGSGVTSYPSTLPDIDASTFTLVATANVDSATFAGSTVAISSTSNTVVGTSTTFTTSFNVGDQIKVGSDVRTITTITDSTNLTVDKVWPSTLSGQSYKKAYVAGKIIPITSSTIGPKSYVILNSATSFTINTSEMPASGLSVDVVFDVLRTGVSPAKKDINKNRFVKLDTTSNPSGPWCLGVSDIHQIRAVYGANSSSTHYSLSNADVTRYFTFDSGQKDTHYDYGYLYPVPGYKTTQTDTPYLLVQLDYFTANTDQGIGFYTVESYPISDGLPGTVNVSSTSITGSPTTSFADSFSVGNLIQVGNELRTISAIHAGDLPPTMTVSSAFTGTYTNVSYFNYDTIQTKDIPLYVDESGNKRPLRNYVDFRTPSVQTAVNTGECDVSNSTQVTASLALASENPSSTLTLSVPTGGLNVPSYGRNMQSDYTYYLPRKDLVMFTPDNKIKVKEGLSSLAPQTPIYPDNGMVVAVVNIPAYPSLTTDQRDALLPINQSSTSLVRDVGTAISTNAVTSRRYTMRDIGILDSRISDLEYYQSLSLLEKKATDMTVTDANGLDRYKNGIFVETFNDYTKSEVSNPEYSFAIDSSQTRGRPRIIREVIHIEFDSPNSTNVQKTGNFITLPYVETPFIVQPYSTKYRSAAHLSVAWNGNIKLFPAYDNQTDDNITGSLKINLDLTTPWDEFAKSPMGSIYGNWRSSSADIDVVDLGWLGIFNSNGTQGGWTPDNQKEAETAALNLIHQKYGQNVTIGKFNINYGAPLDGIWATGLGDRVNWRHPNGEAD